MSNERTGIGFADDLPRFGRWWRIADMPVVGRLVTKPGGFLLIGVQHPHAGPFRTGWGSHGRTLDHGFVRPNERHEIADAHHLDRTARGFPDRRFIESL